ncbi:hypothetical protein HO133_003802 [Letharia lupina]|uniref:C2H2-type domain-containing protein n=1 Tax=Letharia lupina TaxID=560253 RepID=A0A8H6CAK4_9LECA|nr:uncharacterized protein HO133_003802 [Letharia lupina]KAF6219977.1 hypothetical protein HO133_003802 [Letharia lupina]
MDFSYADGPRSSEPGENNYEYTIDTPDDEWWGSMLSIGHSDATGHQELPEPTIASLGSTSQSSQSRGYLSSLQPSSSLYFAGAQSSYPAIQLPANSLATFDAPFTLHAGGTSEMFVTSTLGDASSSNSFEAVGTASAGHESGLDNTTPSDESCDVSRGLDQQSLALSGAVNTTRYEAHHKDLRSNFDSTLQSHKNQETSDALADSHAGYVTKDNPATPYSYFFEDDRREQRQNGIQMDEYEAVEQPSGIYPVPRHGNEPGARLASDRTSPSSLSPGDSSQAFLLTTSLTSATQTHSTNDSWKCDDCGRVLATKGTKNRNRNKRRHHCPGTGPKNPCPICPKSFNRSDTRLLHLRKWHPEIHMEPPRPRKRKDL